MSWFGGRRPEVTGASGEVFSPGPLADLGDVTEASFELSRVKSNLNAEQIAGEIIYDEVIEQVRQATGDVLQNPYRLSFKERYIDSLGPSFRSPYNPRLLAINKARDDFQLQYWKLQQQQLDMQTPFEERLPDFNFKSRVRQLVLERQARLEDVAGRASDFDALTGTLAGGFGAVATDPVQYLTFAIPTGGSSTILGNAVRGTVANAAIGAAVELPVAEWHRDLGLDYTAEDFVTNVVFAGLFGGLLEGGGSAAYRAVRGSPEYRRAKALLAKLPEDHTLRQVLSGKRKDVIAAGRKLRGALDSVGRFALDAEEAQLRARENVPEGTHPREHETTLDEAQRAAARDEPPPRASRAATTERPELKDLMDDALADTAKGRDARELARLADGAYAEVQAGRLTPAQGALVSRLVPDEAFQTGIARELAELGPLTPAQSRVAIGALLEARAPGAAARALGGEAEILARQRGEVAALDAQYGELKDLETVRAEVERLELRQINEGRLDDAGAARLEAQQGLLRHLLDVREAYEADFEALSARQAAEREGQRLPEMRSTEPDPDAEAVGETFEQMLGDAPLTPEDLGRVTDTAARPRAEVTDFRAEADAIDQLAAPEDPRAGIRAEAEAAFGAAAARIIADDPGTDQGRVYLFQKKGWEDLQTSRQEGYGTPEFEAAREFEFDGERVTGYEAARAKLKAKAESAAGPDGPAPNREAVILVGPPGAGKSSVGAGLARETRSAIVTTDSPKVHMDEFHANGRDGADVVHEEAEAIMRPVRDELLDEGKNVVIEKLGKSWASIARQVELLKAAGYTVRIASVHAPREILKARILERYLRGEHFVDDDVLDAAIAGIGATLAAARKSPEIGGILEIDNGGDVPHITAGKEAFPDVETGALQTSVRNARLAGGSGGSRRPGEPGAPQGQAGGRGRSEGEGNPAEDGLNGPPAGDKLFRKTGAKPGKTWMKPIDITNIKEDAAVLNRALEEAAACAAGYPIAEGALAVAAAGLGAAALGAGVADAQRQREEDAALSAARRAVRESPLWKAQQAAAKERDHLVTAAKRRLEARRMARAWKEEALALWRADLNSMPAYLPQYRLNQHVQDLTGVRADFLDLLIGKESSGDWSAQAETSSARGGGQFIDSTWRNMMRQYGPKYGHKNTLDGWTDEEKAKVMELRTDSRWGTVMVAEYALENDRAFKEAIGRSMTQKEAYLAHFLGVTDFVKLRSRDSALYAADITPAAANANPSIFWIDSDPMRPRTIAQVFALQGRNFSNDPLLTPETSQ